MGFDSKSASEAGSKSKRGKSERTEQWDKFASWFMSDGMDRLQEEMAKLEGKEFVKEVKDLMEFFQPKLARTEIEHSADEHFKLEVGVKEDKDKADGTKELD